MKRRFANQVRISAGKFKGRKIHFSKLNRIIRPTNQLMRETLFNWLRNDIELARCLDLFAGTGALGFEALSQGAEHVIFVDNHYLVAKNLTKNIQKLEINDLSYAIYCQNGLKFIKNCQQKFNIIFIDPPFDTDLITRIIHQIDFYNLLFEGGLIYIESRLNCFVIPPFLQLLRQKHCGEAQGYLCSYIKNENK